MFLISVIIGNDHIYMLIVAGIHVIHLVVQRNQNNTEILV
jgi:hypothetical protein